MKSEVVSISFIREVKQIIEESKKLVVRNVNTIMLHAYWEIGKRIVEEEQKGKVKSNYGDYIIRNLSKELTNEYGKGFSTTILKMMRRFYNEYPIDQTLSDQLSWSHYLELIKKYKEEFGIPNK